MCLICYAGFLRFSELVNLKRSNIKFYSDHVNLNIEKSKTDIYREGKDVIISATNNYICPVAMLSRYLLLANISHI
jgi:integrase